MDFRIVPRPARPAFDALLVFAFEGEDDLVGRWKPLHPGLAKAAHGRPKEEGFKGGLRQAALAYPDGGAPAKRLIVAGLGKRADFVLDRLRIAAAAGAGRARDLKIGRIAVLPPVDGRLRLNAGDATAAVAEGIAFSQYRFDRYKTPAKDAKRLERADLLADGAVDARRMKGSLDRVRVGIDATLLVRDLVNEPPATATPRHLVDIARRLARKHRFGLKVMDEKQMAKAGMNGILGVAAGADEPPRFAHLTYRAPGARRTIAIVGKGITFDSGGLCIKPADSMRWMKNDMAGAATVLGVFQAIGRLRPKVNVHGIFGATENMPGRKAYKPGDVVKALNGKTMEIINTDAEGRVTLADTLSYATRLKPDAIIDLATLTGACVVALGPTIAGLFANRKDLSDELIACGEEAGEKIWPLPLETDYADMIKSPVADVKNVGERWGGAITAALFLKEFVDPKIPWAHADIAGPALVEKPGPYQPVGGTGFMVRTLLNYLERQ